jgi:hypothetical protein
VFLDIEGAFDNSSFGSMDATSGEHEVALTMRRWIDAMLRCRSIRVENRGSSVRVLINRGCPQGGILSPLLWNMVVDYLLRRLHMHIIRRRATLMMWFCCKKARCHPLAPSSVRQREWEWLFKSHCTSWSLETACRQSRMWLKKPNPGLTRYLLRLP